MERTFRDRHGVVHDVYWQKTKRFGWRKHKEWFLACTNESLYHLKTQKGGVVTCLSCLALTSWTNSLVAAVTR